MAIGARILSNNLSGQTATVTFLPSTGGTINLGSQTIPFNNLTTHPYGVYQIYVPLYDYTYEITVNTPTNVKSFTFISKLLTNNNYGSLTSNYSDFTVEIFDLDVDVTGWYINDLYPLTNSGYAYYFSNRDTCNLQWVFFVDSIGRIIEDYQTNCDCDYDYDDLDGKWVTFTDQFNGVFKYFNGTDVYTYNFDSSYQDLYINSGWDAVMSNNNFSISIVNNTGNTKNFYIVDGVNLQQFGDTIDLSLYYTNVNTYFDGSFIQIITIDDSTNQTMSVKYYDGVNGNLLQEYDITSHGICNQYNNNFYGNNKNIIYFWNYLDESVYYLILQYNGNTDVLNIETHARLNYNSIGSNSRSNLYPNNGGSDAFYVMFYQSTGSNGIGEIVSYCDILYMLSADTTIQTYVFQDSGIGDKTIRNYGAVNNNIFLSCDNGDGYASVMSITNTGVTFHNTNLLMSSNPQINDIVECGNGYVGSYFDSDSTYNIMSLIYILEDGTLGDIVNGITLTGNYQRRTDYLGNIYQFLTYGNGNYYINQTSNSFQTDITLNGSNAYVYYPDGRFIENFIRPGLMLTLDPSTKDFVILSSTGLTSTFTLPETNNFDIEIGETMFSYTYLDIVSGLTTIHLYDFDFNLIQSATTEFTSWYDTGSCGDNFFVIINENNRYYNYLVTENEIVQNSITDLDSYYTFNDYVWWD